MFDDDEEKMLRFMAKMYVKPSIAKISWRDECGLPLGGVPVFIELGDSTIKQLHYDTSDKWTLVDYGGNLDGIINSGDFAFIIRSSNDW